MLINFTVVAADSGTATGLATRLATVVSGSGLTAYLLAAGVSGVTSCILASTPVVASHAAAAPLPPPSTSPVDDPTHIKIITPVVILGSMLCAGIAFGAYRLSKRGEGKRVVGKEDSPLCDE